ncbi:MAG: hypothetical protein WA970_03645, partial [Gammaproteobacteria bacterium]
MAEILWHRRETRRQTEKTNFMPVALEGLISTRLNADANLETATGHLAPYGHTGRTADSGSNMSCCPLGQTLRKIDLRR